MPCGPQVGHDVHVSAASTPTRAAQLVGATPQAKAASGLPVLRASADVPLPSVLDTRVTSLSAVLDLVRSGNATTRPELEHLTGLGRKVVAQRVGELVDAGLVDESTFGPSTGGRAPRQLQFVAGAGLVLVAHFGATAMSAGVTDLSGRLRAKTHRSHAIATGPESALALMLELWADLLAELEVGGAQPPVWGVGVGVPGPVEYSTARPVSPPIMPGWDDFPIRERVQEHWPVPVWVDNEVNAMALGELRAGVARGYGDVVYLKLGTGIGAGIVSGGVLHRGAQGVAGDVGHIPVREHLGVTCHCGRTDCVEAVAGGAALVRQAAEAAREGRSTVLAALQDRDGSLAIRHLVEAVQHSDPTTMNLLRTSGRRIGEMVASVVNILNPALVVIGGPVAETGDLLLAAIRQAVYDRSLPLATRDLRITRSFDNDTVGFTGSAFTVIDEIFAPGALEQWIGQGRPDVRLAAHGDDLGAGPTRAS